jgi:succinate dehydrogenase/fumarate reductase cytochrome b subunit
VFLFFVIAMPLTVHGGNGLIAFLLGAEVYKPKAQTSASRLVSHHFAACDSAKLGKQ